MVPDLLSESSSVDKRVDRQRIDLDLALKLYRRYRNYHTVADMMGRNVQSVHKALKGVKSMFLDAEEIESIRVTRVDSMIGAEDRLLRSLVDEVAIKKAPLAARATAFGIVNERRRLEEGKSTANILTGIVPHQKAALEDTMKALAGEPAIKPAAETEPAVLVQNQVKGGKRSK